MAVQTEVWVRDIEEIRTNNVKLYNTMYKAEYGVELT